VCVARTRERSDDDGAVVLVLPVDLAADERKTARDARDER
jgi:hypothetical protein